MLWGWRRKRRQAELGERVIPLRLPIVLLVLLLVLVLLLGPDN